MKISVTSSYQISFQVAYHEQTEGGMNYGEFGPETDAIEKAITYLELAQIDQPKTEWVIVCNVTKNVNGAKS